MKNFILYLSLILSLSLGFTSCEKDEILEPSVSEPVKQEIRLYGKWLLVDGDMFMENMETHVKVKYSHFDGGKAESSLRYEGSLYEIEDIVKNQTTWSFYEPPSVPNYGTFVLNSDTFNPYGFYVTKSNWTIVEHPTATSQTTQMGGSARPIDSRVHDFNNKIITIIVQEGTTSINGYNYTYFSELYFRKIEEW